MSLEYPITFNCEKEQLIGLIHQPAQSSKIGVIIVVAGGPQYRVGAHRQFVLLARKLARNGILTMRFDMRGMGDSSGEYLGFQYSKPDINSAINALFIHEPDVQEIILLGECESASGILFYAYTDNRVKNIVLINPWVRTKGGQAQTFLKHYYFKRIFEADFWKKALKGQFNPIKSINSFVKIALTACHWKRKTSSEPSNNQNDNFDSLPLPIKTAVQLKNFTGNSLILTSGKDYIAREFDEVIKNTKAWKGLMSNKQVERCDLLEADHTFSRNKWREQASDTILEWIKNL